MGNAGYSHYTVDERVPQMFADVIRDRDFRVLSEDNALTFLRLTTVVFRVPFTSRLIDRQVGRSVLVDKPNWNSELDGGAILLRTFPISQ